MRVPHAYSIGQGLIESVRAFSSFSLVNAASATSITVGGYSLPSCGGCHCFPSLPSTGRAATVARVIVTELPVGIDIELPVGIVNTPSKNVNGPLVSMVPLTTKAAGRSSLIGVRPWSSVFLASQQYFKTLSFCEAIHRGETAAFACASVVNQEQLPCMG
jgi:hypothetical protein